MNELIDERSPLGSAATREFVTLHIGDVLFGVEVTDIQDVFSPQAITPVPLSSDEIAGVLNLRGRIVTAINARAVLGFLACEETDGAIMAVGVEKNGESYAIIIDSVGDVLRLPDADLEKNPCNLDPGLQRMSRGVYRLDGELLVILDFDRMLDFESAEAA